MMIVRRKKSEFVNEYPKFKSLKCHPDYARHIWLVTLQNGKQYSVAFGNLREWLNAYAK